jgi:hypothetical protein
MRGSSGPVRNAQRYRIGVGAFAAGTSGQFQLAVGSPGAFAPAGAAAVFTAPPASAPTAPPPGLHVLGEIGIGQTVSAVLDPSAAPYDYRPMAFHTLQCAPGLQIDVNATSDWDNVAAIVAPDGRTQMAFVDDAVGTNARIVWSCPDARRYAIGVGAFQTGTGGPFQLSVGTVGAPPASQPSGAEQAHAQAVPVENAGGSGVPVNRRTFLGNHNAQASLAYGYLVLASQSRSIDTQLSLGARMLEIDITYADPPDVPLIDEGPADVYICHCGNAPFVGFGSVAGTTYGLPRRTLTQIVQEIDRWLMRNPGEIAFVVFENNAGAPATAEQANSAIARAGVRAGTYVHPGPESPWPTQEELVQRGSRLIFLAADGPDIGGPHINEKGYIRWKGFSDGTLTVGDDEANRFLLFGHFHSILTLPSAAAAYNPRHVVEAVLSSWTRVYPDRGPSFLQVNHNDVGDALGAINAFNRGRPGAGQVASRLTSYTVFIRTGTSSGAGTDSNISVNIVGHLGQTGPITLNPLRSNDVFENGAREQFILRDAVNVGPITQVIVTSDGRYAGSDWEFAEITVTDSGSGSTFSRVVNQWVNGRSVDLR